VLKESLRHLREDRLANPLAEFSIRSREARQANPLAPSGTGGRAPSETDGPVRTIGEISDSDDETCAGKREETPCTSRCSKLPRNRITASKSLSITVSDSEVADVTDSETEGPEEQTGMDDLSVEDTDFSRLVERLTQRIEGVRQELTEILEKDDEMRDRIQGSGAEITLESAEIFQMLRKAKSMRKRLEQHLDHVDLKAAHNPPASGEQEDGAGSTEQRHSSCATSRQDVQGGELSVEERQDSRAQISAWLDSLDVASQESNYIEEESQGSVKCKVPKREPVQDNGSKPLHDNDAPAKKRPGFLKRCLQVFWHSISRSLVPASNRQFPAKQLTEEISVEYQQSSAAKGSSVVSSADLKPSLRWIGGRWREVYKLPAEPRRKQQARGRGMPGNERPSLVKRRNLQWQTHADLASDPVMHLRFGELFALAPHLASLHADLVVLDERIRQESQTGQEADRESNSHVLGKFSSTAERVKSRALLRDKHNQLARERRGCLQRFQRALLCEAEQLVVAYLEDFTTAIVDAKARVAQSPVNLDDLQEALWRRTLYSQHWQVITSLPRALAGSTVHNLQRYETQALRLTLKAISDAADRRASVLHRLAHAPEQRCLLQWRAGTHYSLSVKIKIQEFSRHRGFRDLMCSFDDWCLHYEAEKTQMDRDLQA